MSNFLFLFSSCRKWRNSKRIVSQCKLTSVCLFRKGACGGTLACSTCHVIVDEAYYERLPEPEEEELDMLDLAFNLEET